MKVLVTGSNGFIAKNLIQFLADNKADYPLLQEEIEFVGFQKKNSFGL